ncbi:MAG: T9SS type A sorting domain-containing protein [Bacteroidia bacterium]|nr:T9SS type A sorting domain-containing protein [Bacteroidia bacterium]
MSQPKHVALCITVAIILGFGSNSFAQKDSTVFFLDKSSMQTNVLFPTTEPLYGSKYNGVDNSSLKNINVLNIISDLKSYSLNKNLIPPYDSISKIASLEMDANKRIPILMVNYKYDKFKSNALTDSLVRIVNGKFYDVTPRNSQPFEQGTIFCTAPLREKIQQGTIKFFISRNYFITNEIDPSQIQIDFDDGAGFRNVNFGSEITITYNDNAERNISVKFINQNNSVLLAKATSTKEYCIGTYPWVDDRITITSTIPYFGTPYNVPNGQGESSTAHATGFGKADIYIKYGNGHSTNQQLVKPFVFIEGIDFGAEHSYDDPAGNSIRHGDVGWCEFWGNSFDPSAPTNYLRGNTEFKNSSTILNALLNEGYDIMFVDFYDGADFIQRNAMVVVELLQQIKSRQAQGNYAHQPTVLLGASMGGQVARYALDYMEQNNIKHCVRNYISFDSPHKGANIPLSLQQWIEFFANNGTGSASAQLQLVNKLNRPATRQLLIKHYDDGNTYTYTDRSNYQAEIDALGFPSKCRKVALACGSRYGAEQDYLSPGQQLLKTDWSPLTCLNTTFIKADCYAYDPVGGMSFTGSAFKNISILNCLSSLGPSCALCTHAYVFDNKTLMNQSGGASYDNAPGGSRYTSEQIAAEYNDYVATQPMNLGGSAEANPTGQPSNPHESFIPTTSALGLYGNPSLTTNITQVLPVTNQPFPSIYPFDAYYASSTNLLHVQLEAGLTQNGTPAIGNMDWAHKEVLNSEPSLPFVLSGSTPNNGIYNMCRIENRLLTSCTVENGGHLWFNRNWNADMHVYTVPYPPVGVSPPVSGSILEVNSCDCGITVDIKNGGEFYLGDNSVGNKAIVTLKSGDNFLLRNGSHLIIDDYSKLILEAGVNVTIEPGAVITLKGEHSLFEIQGNCNIDLHAQEHIYVNKGSASSGGTMKLNSGSFILRAQSHLDIEYCKVLLNDYVFDYYHNATISLTGEDAALQFGGIINLQPGADLHFSGDGYFGFKLNQLPNGDINIFGDASNSITLQGSGKTDKIAEIEPYTYVKASDNIAHLTVRNGAIEMGSQATWIAASSYSLLNLNVGSLPGQGYGSGFLVTAVPNHEIDNVTFTGLYEGLRALMMWGDANYLRVKNSNFIACSNALKFVDKGVILNNVDFKDCQAPIVGVNASTPSILSDVSIKATLGNQPVAINISTTASGTLSLNNCLIPLDASGYFYSEGISYSGPGTMALKCSKIYGESNAIKIDNFASLNLAPLPGFNFGGNNSISSENKGIDGSICNQLILQDGFNEFLVTNTNSSLGPLMSGYFQNYIPTSLFSAELNANHNKWADEQAPLTTTPNGNTLTDLHHGMGPNTYIDVIDNFPDFATCENALEPSEPNEEERGIPLEYCPRCPHITSDNFSQRSMNDAFHDALSKQLDTSNLDNLLTSFNMFYDILMTSTTFEESRINWESDFAYNKLKELFGLCIQNGRIAKTNSAYSEKMLEAIQRMITLSKEKDEDIREFYFWTDYAGVQRLLNLRDDALYTLERTAPCLNLTKEQVDFLTYLISEITAEQMLLNGSIGYLDFYNYAGITNSNRTFKKFGNSQANIDSIISLPSSTSVTMVQTVSDDAGFSYQISTVTVSSSVNYHLTKFDVNSGIVWEQIYDGLNGGVDSAKLMAIDDNNFIYVTGKSWNGIDYDVVTVKYDTSGNQYWVAKYNDLLIGNDEPIGLLLDSNFKLKIDVHSYNDTLEQYRTIYYSQCDSNCVQNYRIKNSEINFAKNQAETDLHLQVYPNPANDLVSISIDESNLSQTFFLKMYDATGKLVFNKKINARYLLDTTPFGNGIYQLVVSTNTQSMKQRIVLE